MGTAKKLWKQLGLVIVIVLIAVFLDWVAHSTSEQFYVPFEYYRNKFIFATFWIMLGLWIFGRMRKPIGKAVLVSLLAATLLQTKYFLLGYSNFFVFLFLLLHFGMFLVPAFFLFKKYPEILIVGTDRHNTAVITAAILIALVSLVILLYTLPEGARFQAPRLFEP